MFNRSNMPQYKAVFYANNPQTGYYTKTQKQPEKTPVMRLPYEVKVEPTQLHQIKCNASEIIRGKDKFKKSGSYKFFTGLQETDFLKWFSGNDYEIINGKKLLSLCLFHFSDNGNLTVFYFPKFYIDKREARERFITDIIPGLIQKYLLAA